MINIRFYAQHYCFKSNQGNFFLQIKKLNAMQCKGSKLISIDQ